MELGRRMAARLPIDTMFSTREVAQQLDHALCAYLEAIADPRIAGIGRRLGERMAGHTLRRRVDAGTLTLMVLGEAKGLGTPRWVKLTSDSEMQRMQVVRITVDGEPAHLAYDRHGRACLPAEMHVDDSWIPLARPAVPDPAPADGAKVLEGLLARSAQEELWIAAEALEGVTGLVSLLGLVHAGWDKTLARDLVACGLAEPEQVATASRRQLVVALALRCKVSAVLHDRTIEVQEPERRGPDGLLVGPTTIQIHVDGWFRRLGEPAR